MASAIVQDLKEHILERSLGVFYPDNYDFKPCIKRVEKLRKDFPQITGELADGLAVLTLYDLAILIGIWSLKYVNVATILVED